MAEALSIDALRQLRIDVRRRIDVEDLAGAEALARGGLARAPQHPALLYDLSEILLRGRRYAEGWPAYEARRAVLPRASIPPVGGPEWMGGDLDGARIAVCGEQGLGDQIMFGRYLGELRARGAEVSVALPLANLSALFEAAGYPLAPFVADQPVAGVDGWTYAGSLPLKLGLSLPPPPVYLDLPATRGGGVGVCATGSPIQWNDSQRSLPPDLAERLGRLGRDLRPQATGLTSMLDTARIVAGLDLVISVDTVIAHLALSMGKPTWVILAARGRDFRWNDGLASDWYPQARLFKQKTPGDWPEVLDRVEAALRAEGFSP